MPPEVRREVHYLPPDGADPEDFARGLAASALPEPDPSDLGSVFMSAINKREDYWCAAWQRGDDHRDVIGSREVAMAWARAQRASHYRTIDDVTGEWVPLTVGDGGDDDTAGDAAS